MGAEHSIRSLFLAALIALGLCWPLAGWSNPKEMRLCFNKWPPYTNFSGRTAMGISVDILKEAATRTGLEVSFHELPWKRCLQSVRDGTMDGVLDAARREEFLQGPVTYSVYSNTMWVQQDSHLSRFDLKTLRGVAIGLVSGYVYPDSLMAGFKDAGAKIDYAVDDATNIRKLAFGRVDAIIADFASTKLIVNIQDFKLRALSPTHSADKLYVSFNRGRSALHGIVNDALRQIVRDGFADKIYRKYIGVGIRDVLKK